MLANLVIRRARLEDSAVIADVHVRTWQSAYQGILNAEFLQSISVELREKTWINWLSAENDSSFTFVAEMDGLVVGFVNAGPERSGDPLYQGEVNAIYIYQRVQKQGIGRELIEAAVNEFRKRAIPSMLIWVLADNPSRKFYEALGGSYVREKDVEIGTQVLREVAYGWLDLAGMFK
jgi:GNAT superfamily N-acetyltransferase